MDNPVDSTAATNNADSNNLLDVGIDLLGGGVTP